MGNLIVLGPLADAIVSALQGAVFVGGIGALGAALYSLGIPKNSTPQYETAIMTDKFLLIGHGTEEEVDRATDIIQTTNVVEYAVHAG